jgi:hypothetical protein
MVLMVVLGVGLLALGACCAVAGKMAPLAQLPPQTRAQFEELAKQSNVSAAMIFQAMVIVGALCAVPALALLVLSIFVYRRSLGGTIVALVVGSLLVLGVGLMLPGVLIHAAEAPAGVAMVVIPLGLLIWLVVLLARSIKAAGRHREELREQQWRLRQSMENRHRYEQGGGSNEGVGS